MSKSVTKVRTPVKPFSQKKEAGSRAGWRAVLADIQADIESLKKMVPIVERKISRGEPWPGDSARRG